MEGCIVDLQTSLEKVFGSKYDPTESGNKEPLFTLALSNPEFGSEQLAGDGNDNDNDTASKNRTLPYKTLEDAPDGSAWHPMVKEKLKEIDDVCVPWQECIEKDGYRGELCFFLS